MKINAYEDLKNITHDISDNTQGELCTYLGNNINSPIEGGLGMYNRAVNDLFTHGDYTIPINEGIEYIYDIKIIYDNIDKIRNAFRNQLKKINGNQSNSNMKHNDTNQIDGLPIPSLFKSFNDDEVDFTAIKQAINAGKRTHSLISDIKIKDKTKFLNTLKEMFNELPSDQIQKLISSISGFISTFDIKSVRELLNKLKSEFNNI